ncbi:D(2) dopamine receptor [Brachionus plicatilis]|uniref:D(2) dopamine receptor n=1 Tax=Brachionus plicatilis TaxID=10195 RepID=A0A3M7QKX3_BRAPC|nr:D(2) dopamine receptor [Brachionus plicatilis]
MNASDEETLSECLLTPDNKNLLRFSLECFYEKLSTDYYFLFLSCLFAFFIVVDVALNFVLLSSIFIEKFKTRVDICFMSNAFADLLMGLVIMPFTAIYTLFGHFPFGPYVCFLWNCLDFTTGTTSMLHLALISFDRYLSVSKPLKYTNKQRADNRFSVHGLPTSLILIFIWFFSCTAWIPVLLYFKSTSLNEPQLINECGMAGSPLIIVPHSLFVYYIPMFLIVYFYTKTIVIVNQKLKRPVKSHHAQQSQSAAQSRFCCIVKYVEPRKESIRLHEAKTDTDFSKLSRSDTTINNLRLVHRSASLEINLNKSLENSKHLNQLYQLHGPLRRTYHSSINFALDGADEPTAQQTQTANKPSAGAHLANMAKNGKKESKQRCGPPRSKFKLSITSSFSRAIVVNKEKSVTYKLGVIMATFIVSWAPFCVLWSLVSLCNKWPGMCFVSDNLYIVSFWLAYFNSIFTPLILLYNNQKYRKSVLVFGSYLSRKTAANCSSQLSAAGVRSSANCPHSNRLKERKSSINKCTYADKDLLFCERAKPI